MILALILSSLAFADVDDSVRTALKWDNTELAATTSDYALAVSVASTLGFSLAGDNRWEKTGAALGAYLGSVGVNQLVKRSVKRVRPGGQDNLSFFSGHTSTAFTGAGIMCLRREHCAESLALAALVGYLRIAGDWHWFSDVAVGAGAGFAFGRLVPTIFVRF